MHACACCACMYHTCVHPCVIDAWMCPTCICQHTCTHTCICTCKHACDIAHRYVWTCMGPHMHSWDNACSHVCICTCMWWNVYMHGHACISIFANEPMHLCMCAHIHSWMHVSSIHWHMQPCLHICIMRSYGLSMRTHDLNAMLMYRYIVPLY